MTISVLLPTRNRLEYLAQAIESVRAQDSSDWEIVISDNDSEEDIRGHVEELGDERIRYARTERFLPVTENWNRALSMSRGEYVVMMGDDDALLPGYIRAMERLIAAREAPELIYVGSLLFTYPGVDPAHPAGFLAPNSFAEFFGDGPEPSAVDHPAAVAAVRRSMAFRHVFNFNMQLSLVSRELIERVRGKGEFFQSAFPDFYATCAAMLNARAMLADPTPRVVIGVTPKSYGFFHLNEQESAGREFLGAGQEGRQAPGTNLNEGWLAAMETLERHWGAGFGLSVDHRRYRMIQAGHVYTSRFRGSASEQDLARLQRTLPLHERLLFSAGYGLARVLARLLPQRLWDLLSRRALGQYPGWEPEREEGRYATILEVFESRRREQV